MKNGYDICWTDYALEELNQTISYLELNFTKKEIFENKKSNLCRDWI